MNNRKKKPAGRSSLSIVNKYLPELKVKIVVDSHKPAYIEVTDKDARSKAMKNPKLCAFAHACQRAFNADGVIIGLSTSYIVLKDQATRYGNPETVTREIVSFDRHGDFEPGVYLLSPVPASRALGVNHRGGNSYKKPKNPRVFRHFTKNVRVISE